MSLSLIFTMLKMDRKNKNRFPWCPTGMRAVFACGLLLLLGCERRSEQQYVSAPGVNELAPPLQEAIRQALDEYCGTPRSPKLLGGDDKNLEHLKHGALIYQRDCLQCHGASGDGNGPAAAYLNPRPRDYRRGIFKFTSTGYGNKPRREDLLRTVSRGIVGTSMPSFARLPKQDLDAVVDYVLALTHRGELENRLLAQAQNEDELDKDTVDEAASSIVERWKGAAADVVEPLTKMPPFSPETVAAGEAAFQKRDCFKCHGRDGRGGLAGGIEVGQDAWGRKAAAADLTSGMLHGGQTPLDIYRRIYAGINGSPMPAFKEAFAKDPDTVWHLTHYVLHLADKRRRGVQFPAGAATPTATRPESGAADVLPTAGDQPTQPSDSADDSRSPSQPQEGSR